MTPNQSLLPAPDAVEELFLSAGAGDASATAKLVKVLRDAGAEALLRLPRPALEAWATGAALFLDAVSTKKSTAAADLELACLMARAGLDSQLLRDAIARAARERFAAWPDPAGLLAALGVHDMRGQAVEVMRRWDLFAALKEGVFCWHPAQGAGVLEEIDGIGSELRLRFARPERLGLDIFLAAAVVVAPGSWFDELLRARKPWPAPGSRNHEADARLAASLVPPRPDWQKLAGELAARAGGGAAEALQAFLTGQAAAPAAKPKAAAAGTGSRAWWEARSVQELADILRRDNAFATPPPADLADFEKLWHDIAGRKDLALPFCEAMARLWGAYGDQEWFSELLRRHREASLCWQDRVLVTDIAAKLPGRYLPEFFAASLAVVGAEWLVALCLQLPLRLWAGVEKVLAAGGVPADALVKAAVDTVTRGEASADVLVWLWRGKTPERAVLAQPSMIFRVLAKPVRGNYLKANRDLLKLLLEDEAFQRFVVRDGDETAVAAMISCARHLPVLEKGEQQSLLVLLVRQFPQYRHLVEQKTRAVERRPIGKITSIRSYQLWRRELDDIVGRQIPENSQAIAHARSYGDLRENAEYKAAKEKQRFLNARRAELATGLDQVQQFDFSSIIPEQSVIPGCTVVLKEDGSSNLRTFHLLGLWDSKPETGIISYDTELGRALIGHEVGETLETSIGTVTIMEIKPLTDELRRWAAGDDLA